MILVEFAGQPLALTEDEFETARERATCDYVIEWGGHGIKSIKKAFKRAAVQAGFEDVITYTLRHTAATWMANRGVNLWEISGYLGHTSTKTVERVYAKHHPNYLQNAAAALSQISLKPPKRKRLPIHRGGIKSSKAA